MTSGFDLEKIGNQSYVKGAKYASIYYQEHWCGYRLALRFGGR